MIMLIIQWQLLTLCCIVLNKRYALKKLSITDKKHIMHFRNIEWHYNFILHLSVIEDMRFFVTYASRGLIGREL